MFQSGNKISVLLRLLWIGLCALAMLTQTRLLLGEALRPGWLDGFVLGGAVFAYHFTHPNRRMRAGAWLAGGLGGICFLLSLWGDGVSDLRVSSWQGVVLVPVALWSLYYGLQSPGNAGLRGVPMAKPLAVALAWAWVTVLLPVPTGRWGEAGMILLGRTAFVFALALAYDWADLAYDQQRGLPTLAGRLGRKRTFLLINGALLCAALCSGANVYLKIYEQSMAFALLISLAWSAGWLHFVLSKNADVVAQKMLIDGLMLLQCLILGIVSFCTE
ncbi:MAG: hypothetical protein KIS77_00790 [Saprospiraceae bacterium]|nr:hypothetical protein [Saprospiraceae bacterium]